MGCKKKQSLGIYCLIICFLNYSLKIDLFSELINIPITTFLEYVSVITPHKPPTRRRTHTNRFRIIWLTWWRNKKSPVAFVSCETKRWRRNFWAHYAWPSTSIHLANITTTRNNASGAIRNNVTVTEKTAWTENLIESMCGSEWTSVWVGRGLDGRVLVTSFIIIIAQTHRDITEQSSSREQMCFHRIPRLCFIIKYTMKYLSGVFLFINLV